MRYRFLVTGGEQYDDAVKRPEGARFKCAKLLQVDMENNSLETLIEYQSEAGSYPEKQQNSIFVSASLCDGTLYLCTSTELLLYQYPDLTLYKRVSYPFFQNLHHAAPFGKYIAVVSSGLDLVVLLDRHTLDPIEFLNVLGKDPWHKYSREIDYRQYVTLKPHEAHPNYVFILNGQLWVTRFNQQDAANLTNVNDTIPIGVERLHDGFMEGGYIYFTSVNGCIIKVNADNKAVESVIDLNDIDKVDGPLGWCRGLYIEDGIAYVGFTRIRNTATEENIKWAVNKFRQRNSDDTRIVAYDLAKRMKIREMLMPKGSINAIYSILEP